MSGAAEAELCNECEQSKGGRGGVRVTVSVCVCLGSGGGGGREGGGAGLGLFAFSGKFLDFKGYLDPPGRRHRIHDVSRCILRRYRLPWRCNEGGKCGAFKRKLMIGKGFCGRPRYSGVILSIGRVNRIRKGPIISHFIFTPGTQWCSCMQVCLALCLQPAY